MSDHFINPAVIPGYFNYSFFLILLFVMWKFLQLYAEGVSSLLFLYFYIVSYNQTLQFSRLLLGFYSPVYLQRVLNFFLYFLISTSTLFPMFFFISSLTTFPLMWIFTYLSFVWFTFWIKTFTLKGSTLFPIPFEKICIGFPLFYTQNYDVVSI